MNWKFILVLIVSILYILWAAHWWSCEYPKGCESNGTETQQVAVPPVKPKVEAAPLLAFNWSNAAAVTGPGFVAYRDSLQGLISEGKVLRIEGRYYPGEAAPEGFANMGLARAAQIAALFKPLLTDAQMELSSRLVEPAPNPIPTGLFECSNITVGDADKPVMLEATEEEVIIYFPTASADRIQAADVELELNKFVATQKRTGRSVSIIGHTDSDASTASNMRLSNNRANAVRQLLISKGVEAGKVTAKGMGETSPKATNNTAAGKAKNRRVEVKLLP